MDMVGKKIKIIKNKYQIKGFRIIWKVINTNDCNFNCEYCKLDKSPNYKILPALDKNIDYFSFFKKISKIRKDMIVDFYGGDGDKKIELMLELNNILPQYHSFAISSNFWFDNIIISKLNRNVELILTYHKDFGSCQDFFNKIKDIKKYNNVKNILIIIMDIYKNECLKFLTDKDNYFIAPLLVNHHYNIKNEKDYYNPIFIKKAICNNQILIHNKYVYRCQHYENHNKPFSTINNFDYKKYIKSYCELNSQCRYIYEKYILK